MGQLTINLTIRGKEAIGDGTRIVCMNSDYVVHITAEECKTFTDSPIKKLIIRNGKEYYEADIKEEEIEGVSVLTAKLPPVERKDYIDLGVCGKDNDDPEETPKYTSKSARYSCDKSILCGTAIIKSAPKLSALTINENGKYIAKEEGADGFYEVEVHIAPKASETRTVTLSMAGGNQIVTPTGSNYTISQVTILKPINLHPENIRKGVDIGGVIGTFEDSALPTEVANADEMEKLLETGNPGAIYRYTGPSSNTFTNGAIYIIEVND